MQLETTIPLRRDGTVIVRCPSGNAYKFLMDEHSGMPACDVQHDEDAIWMLKTQDFYPATEEAVEEAESLLDGIEFDPPTGSDDDGDDEGDDDGIFSERQPFDDTDTGDRTSDIASAFVTQTPGEADEKGEEDPHAVLDDLSKGELKALYTEMVGKAPGRLGEDKMKAAIRAAADEK